MFANLNRNTLPSSFLRIFSLVLVVLIASSCQQGKEYTQKYKQKSLDTIKRWEEDEQEIDEKLAAIIIREYSDLIEQRSVEKELLTHLVNELNPRGLDLDPQYTLYFRISIDEESSKTKTSGASGRYNKIMKLKYELREIYTGEELVGKGTIKTIGSYESNESRFSTYNLEQRVERNLAKELAMELKMHLINDLYEYKSKVE